jgi:hypothetical protein
MAAIQIHVILISFFAFLLSFVAGQVYDSDSNDSTRPANWTMTYEFRCATQGASCTPARQNSRRRRSGCGDASKVIFKTSPWIAGEAYDAQRDGFEGPGFNASGPTGVTKTYIYGNENLKGKYCSEIDSTMFESGWELETCKQDASACTAGINYDPNLGMCVTSATGWDNDTDAAACTSLRMQCSTFNIYYYLKDNTARFPTSDKSIEIMEGFMETGPWYRYKFSAKKWIECSARNITMDQTVAVPEGWSCNTAKRCNCHECTRSSRAQNSHELCSCDAIPRSIMALAQAHCAGS